MTASRSLAVVVLVGFALRIVLLVARGDYLVYDEAYYLMLSRSLREGEGYLLSGLRHVSLSPLQPLLVSLLAILGIPDLLASRLLGAACGALVPVPVALIAGRLAGERCSLPAALLTAASPALLALLPFFPGERWNLYFGSEPLFLVLATAAVLAALLAVDERRARYWVALGALTALAYLTRLEGAVLGAALAGCVAGVAIYRRALWLIPRAALAVVVALALCSPYLVYLRSALGRWALSGRVQAAAPLESAGPAAPATSAGPADAVNAFVWGGRPDALWRALYSLDASGTRMASQYWGVSPTGSAAAAPPPGASPAAVDTTARSNPIAGARVFARGVGAVLPWWLLLVALPGLVLADRRGRLALWLLPLLAAGLVPSLLAYVEPRSMLPLVPAACILASITLGVPAGRLRRLAAAPLAAALLLMLVPTLRDLVRAYGHGLPLQRAAAGRRAVGEYLAAHLPHGAAVVSWHPAVALYARRPWRVLPFDSFERIIAYAAAQRAAVVVFSTFEPSPLSNPPRAFTAVLLDSSSLAPGDSITLEPVDNTPLLFVGRLAGPERR